MLHRFLFQKSVPSILVLVICVFGKHKNKSGDISSHVPHALFFPLFLLLWSCSFQTLAMLSHDKESCSFHLCHLMSFFSSFCNLWNLLSVNSCRHFSVSGIAIVYFNVVMHSCSSYSCHVIFACYLHQVKVMTKTKELNLMHMNVVDLFVPTFI